MNARWVFFLGLSSSCRRRQGEPNYLIQRQCHPDQKVPQSYCCTRPHKIWQEKHLHHYNNTRACYGGDLVSKVPGEGGTHIKFYMTRLHLKVQTLTNFSKMVPLSCASSSSSSSGQLGIKIPKVQAFHMQTLLKDSKPLLKDKPNSRINYYIFPGYQSFSFSCPKGTTSYVFRIVISTKIWHPFIYFVLAAISSTLLRQFCDPVIW